MLETEKRFHLTVLQREQLLAIGHWTEPYSVEDLTFGRHGRQSMSVDGWVIRLRRERGADFLQYKGKRSRFTMEELSIGIDDRATAVALLQTIGLSPGLYLKRTRRQREFQQLRCSIDDVFLLGTFLEVEASEMAIDASTSTLDAILDLKTEVPQPLYGDILLQVLEKDPDLLRQHDSALSQALTQLAPGTSEALYLPEEDK